NNNQNPEVGSIPIKYIFHANCPSQSIQCQPLLSTGKLRLCHQEDPIINTLVINFYILEVKEIIFDGRPAKVQDSAGIVQVSGYQYPRYFPFFPDEKRFVQL